MLFLTFLFVSEAQTTKSQVSQQWHLATYVKTEFQNVSIPQSKGALVSSDSLFSDGMDYLSLQSDEYRLNIGDNKSYGVWSLSQNTIKLGKDIFDIESINSKYLVLSKEEYYPSSQLKIITKLFLYR